ncbi:MAG: YbdK family carboxylate-amine ligase [Nitrospirota bacterium]|nr:MAG: YbdK family carboxylate-amine ligase [Nitrospirota bacterium]
MRTFNSSPAPTIGVELEIQLVDAESLNLVGIAPEVLKNRHSSFEERLKQEFIRSMVEINTDICSSISDVESDLRETIEHLETILEPFNANYFFSSLHPFALSGDQKIMDHPRYQRIMNDLQLVGRRFITQGLHVHVGVDDPEKAVNICNTIRLYLPLLLALSTSSPFYEGESTGLLSYRTKLFEALPLAGMPDYLDGWKEFNHVVDLLIKGGFIESAKDLWWDVRPHHGFGTIEVRICDTPNNFNDILAITSLIQSLVITLAEETTFPDPHIQLLKANKWQAARYGLEGVFVDPIFATRSSMSDAIRGLVNFVQPFADILGCSDSLSGIDKILTRKTGAHSQIKIYEETGDLRTVVSEMMKGFFQ